MTNRTWPDDWDDRVAGVGCPMCANQRREETEFGVRFLAGEFADVYLQRVAPLPGYAIAIWREGHVADPTDLDDAAAAGFWIDTVTAARAIGELFAPAKLNYQTLGNAVPHLHTHIQPRYVDDPAPGHPLPWEVTVAAETVPDGTFRRQVEELRRLIAKYT